METSIELTAPKLILEENMKNGDILTPSSKLLPSSLQGSGINEESSQGESIYNSNNDIMLPNANED